MELTTNKIKNMRHLSEYDLKGIITDLSLYQPVLIDTYDVFKQGMLGADSGKVCIYPGRDVMFLDALKNAKEAVMLPCFQCGQEQAFKNVSGARVIGDKCIKKEINGLMSVVDCLESYSTVYRPPEIGLKNNSTVVPIDEEAHLNNAKRKNKSIVLQKYGHFAVTYVCPLCNKHHIYVSFIVEEVTIKNTLNDLNSDYEGLLVLVKTGQYPSMADVQLFNYKQYKKILKDEIRDYTMAHRLFAAGVGCGSFLYLRRILESIVEQYHDECKKSDDWDEAKYSNADFNEKIKIIENSGHTILPEQIQPVRNKLYGVLSKGIHESSEDECKELFPYVQFAIELIIDQKIQEEKRQERIAEMQKTIQKTNY